MVHGVAGGFYVDGNFGFGQLIAGLHHGLLGQTISIRLYNMYLSVSLL